MRWPTLILLAVGLIATVACLPAAFLCVLSACSVQEFGDSFDERRLINWRKIWRETKAAMERATR